VRTFGISEENKQRIKDYLEEGVLITDADVQNMKQIYCSSTEVSRDLTDLVSHQEKLLSTLLSQGELNFEENYLQLQPGFANRFIEQIRS
jgi:hypothetical protein